MTKLSSGRGGLFCALFWLSLASAIRVSAAGATPVEMTFPVLQIGTQFFTNATVTSHTSNSVFIIHTGGMVNFKVAKLPDDAREKLGYPTSAQLSQAAASKSLLGRTKTQVAKLHLDDLEARTQGWVSAMPAKVPAFSELPPNVLLAIGGGVLMGYLFFCFCCKQICDKVGYRAGVLVWVPLFQAIPLFRAAGMSPTWFLALFVPVLNLFAPILWMAKIVQARRKSPWMVLALLLPLTNIFAFLYLAFSEGGRKEKERGRPIMTLETA